MWNRHGALTIADCFRPALAALAKLASRGLVWADCEALERRHNLGRGTLVVLDVIPEFGTPSYEQRRAILESLLPCDPVFDGDTSCPVPCGSVILTPARRIDSHADALAFYQRLRAANRALGCDFFEGVVMKRADSIYPVELRSATEECRGDASIGSLSRASFRTQPAHGILNHAQRLGLFVDGIKSRAPGLLFHMQHAAHDEVVAGE